MKISAFSTNLGFMISLWAVPLLVACDDAGGGESPEVRLQREEVYRQACVSRILAQRADENLEMLTEAAARESDPSNPQAELTRQAAALASGFARAYRQHAQLRVTAYAYFDSAYNRAATAADSVRYLERANAFTFNLPDPGSIEANVLNSYQAEFTTILSDPNHPCNWDFPF